jgi:anhydro-N-acetylmuramic acid kinase
MTMERVGPPPLPHGEERLVIGLESGSSGDGIDAALVAIKGSCETASIELRHFVYMPFDPETHTRLLELFDFERSTLDKLCVAHAIMGELFADAALLVCEEHGTPIEAVECIGVWGQMGHHLPARTAPFEWRGRKLGSVMRFGDLNRIAVRTGVPAIGDFPNADIAAGGNGAPLVTGLFDYAMYHDPQRNRVVQNIGGIGNCNLLPASGGLASLVGFDTGPGVMVIDGLVRHYTGGAEHFDRGGRRAARGTVDERLLDELMQDPFIQMAPPKAAGWENYGAHFVRGIVELAERAGLSADDVVATATALTAESIALNYHRYLPAAIDEVIVGGGGASNPTLLRMLADRLRCPVRTHEDYGTPSFAIEAMIEALTASELFLGHGNHVPGVAGAEEPTFVGMIAPGYGRRLSAGTAFQRARDRAAGAFGWVF